MSGGFEVTVTGLFHSYRAANGDASGHTTFGSFDTDCENDS